MAFQKLRPEFKLVKIAMNKQRGDGQTIAAYTGYSESHVSNVLNGRRSNQEITNRAYRLATHRSLS